MDLTWKWKYYYIHKMLKRKMHYSSKLVVVEAEVRTRMNHVVSFKGDIITGRRERRIGNGISSTQRGVEDEEDLHPK